MKQTKAFEQFVSQNSAKYPGLLKKLKAEKKLRKQQQREINRRILWSHGIRSFGPPI